MALLRIKSRWHRPEGSEEDVKKTLDEIAGALAFIAWRSALDKAKNLHGEEFDYSTDGQRIAVVGEYVLFQIQIADRLAFVRLEQADREYFITTLSRVLADHMQDNATDLFGPRDYRGGFFDRLNERGEAYREFKFNEGSGPSYPFLRHLGHCIQAIMGNSQTNRWVIDQIMELDAPEVVTRLQKSMKDLFVS